MMVCLLLLRLNLDYFFVFVEFSENHDAETRKVCFEYFLQLLDKSDFLREELGCEALNVTLF